VAVPGPTMTFAASQVKKQQLYIENVIKFVGKLTAAPNRQTTRPPKKIKKPNELKS